MEFVTGVEHNLAALSKSLSHYSGNTEKYKKEIPYLSKIFE